jgi:hypothetical protein
MSAKAQTLAIRSDDKKHLNGSQSLGGKKAPTPAAGSKLGKHDPIGSRPINKKQIEVLNAYFDEEVRKEGMYLKRALENVGYYPQIVEKKQAVAEHRAESAKDVMKIEARRLVALASPEKAVKKLKLTKRVEWKTPKGIWSHQDFVTRAQMVSLVEAQRIFIDFKKVIDTRAWGEGREKFAQYDEMDNDLMVRYDKVWPDFTFEARSAMWNSVWESAANAEVALLIREELTEKEYDALSRPWRRIIGRIHPKDEDIFQG